MWDLRSLELANAHYAVMRQEAEWQQRRHALGRPAPYKPRPKRKMYSPALAWLGTQLVRWGQHLQERHNQERIALKNRPAH